LPEGRLGGLVMRMFQPVRVRNYRYAVV
jgi:hypothetical protein